MKLSIIPGKSRGTWTIGVGRTPAPGYAPSMPLAEATWLLNNLKRELHPASTRKYAEFKRKDL